MSDPIRIVFLTTGLITGGAEVMLYNLLSRIDRSRFLPVVVSLRRDGPMRAPIESLGIEVLSPNMNPSSPNPLPWFRLFRILKHLRPQIIQGWMYHGNLLAALLGKFSGAKAVFLGIHNSIYDLRKEKPLTAWVIRLGAHFSRHCNGVLYCAHKTREQHELIGYDKDKGVVIHNGFDTSRFKPDPAARARLRNELGLPAEAFIVGLVARLDPHKDHPNFFKAAQIVADQKKGIYFVLIGKNVIGSNPVFEELLRSYNLSGRIFLLGERSDIPALMPGFDVLVNSSSSEALPNVIGEALACELPCVVTDVGDSGLMLGEFGVVVPPKDPVRLATGILKIFELKPSERESLVKQGRERIVGLFSLDSMVEKYQSLYQSALELGE